MQYTSIALQTQPGKEMKAMKSVESQSHTPYLSPKNRHTHSQYNSPGETSAHVALFLESANARR